MKLMQRFISEFEVLQLEISGVKKNNLKLDYFMKELQNYLDVTAKITKEIHA